MIRNVRAHTYTLTFGECAETHVQMAKIGKMAENGFTLEDLLRAKAYFESKGVKCELHQFEHPGVFVEDEAYLLIARKAVENADELLKEQGRMEYDRHVHNGVQVVRLSARYNLCFDDEGMEPNYEKKIGRVVAFNSVPALSELRSKLPEIIGEKAENLKCEGNYYYNASICGIRFHGDAERKRVIGVRLGADLPLVFQWYYLRKPFHTPFRFVLSHGDMYFMSEKAVGNDARRIRMPALRHAAGAEKFLKTE